MCGRFTQTKSRKEVLEQLGGIELPPLFHRRYNIAPTQKVAIIRQQAPSRIEDSIWGFKNPHSRAPIINARSETLTERPMFRDLVATNRCLIPADGFYEWKGKQPYYFQTAEKKLFAFAGLWRGDRCVVLTRSADESMRGIHHRMPVILSSNHWNNYLEGFKVQEPPSLLSAYTVSRHVNKVANDDPLCIAQIPEQADLFPSGE